MFLSRSTLAGHPGSQESLSVNQAYEIRFPPWFPWIGVEYLFEPLRGDPRLEDLMRRMD
jgi:hypothetical protein